MQQIPKLQVVHLPTMLTPFPKTEIPMMGCVSGIAAMPERLCFQRQKKILLLKNITSTSVIQIAQPG